MTGTNVSHDMGELVKQYLRDGFVLAECVMDERQLREARAGVEWAMKNVAGDYKWIKQRTYEWFGERPIFVEIIEHPLAIQFSREVLGDDFHLIAAQCSRNTKADPYAPGAMQIHQDVCFFPAVDKKKPEVAEDRYGVSAMWYLQDTPLEMGPTELVPVSQVGTAQHSEDELQLQSSMLWRQAIPAGSLLFFNHRTWHRGAKNATDTPRDLITNAYARPEVEKSQVMTTLGDGSVKYVVWEELVKQGSAVMGMLLRGR